jgi:biopolymer transport protein ExbD
MARRNVPEINAGSMADIAFLLLIFFLVATTMDVDTVISRRLPQKQPENTPPPPELKEKNVFEIMINRNDQMLIEKKDYMNLKELKTAVLEFLDNGGGEGNKGVGKCDYCKGGPDGIVDEHSSDHPNKAVISLKTDRGTSYNMFLSVHDVLGQAYTELRNREAMKLYGVSYEDLLDEQAKDRDDEDIAKKIDKVRELFPEIISEVEPTSN